MRAPVHDNLVNYTPQTGLVRPLFRFCLSCLLAAVCSFAAASQAGAVSWQWQSVDGRERVIIYLDAPGQAKVERTDRTAVTVTLPTLPQTVTQAPGSPNPASTLVTKVSGQGRALLISLKAPAFGYITTSPNPRQVRIDFFSDPLGARWKPKPGAENAPTPETPPATAQAEQPAPPAPETTQAATQPETTAQQQPQAQQQTQEARESDSAAPERSGQQTSPPAPESAAPGQTQAQAITEKPGAPQTQEQSKTQPQPPAHPPAQSQTQDQAMPTPQGDAAAPAPGGLVEKDITDAPPPTALDNLFNSLMAKEEAAGQAPDSAPQRSVPPQPASPPPDAAQPQAAQSGTPAPAASASPNSGATAPAPQGATSDYAFVGAVNPGGPEQWNPQANTISSQRASSSPAPQQGRPGTAARETPKEETPGTPQTQAAGSQISPITPAPEQARDNAASSQALQAQQDASAQSAPVASGETSDALEEVVKNPPPMLSTTGQLAQVQSNIAPPAGQAAGPGIEQNAARAAAQPPDKAPAQEAAPPDASPGATAAGEVFGEVAGRPETLPQDEGHNATSLAGESEQQKAEAPPQLDEDGNPIPPPPDPDAMLGEAAKSLAARDYQKALDDYKAILALPDLSNEQREAAMYGLSDAEYGLGQDNLPEHFAQITDATERAMNFNLQSPRVPSLLMRLGFVNMKMDNLQEAEAYFNMLKRKYPNDPNIPLTYYYWGDYFFKHDDFRRASDQFQYIVQNYPDSKYVREASLGLTRSLYNLGYYEQAAQVGEYLDRRWPRFYVEFPSILTMFGDMALRLNKLDDAKRYYWTYYNIAPTAPDADTCLVHLGDIYMQQGKADTAKEVYQNAANTFPDRDGGLIAQMRLAEDGIHDAPIIQEMDALFDRGYNLRPMEVYNHIINDFPASALVPLATLKLAMWDLWNKRYEDALHTCEQFMAKYPKHELLPNVQEVALISFSRLTADALPEGNYARVVRAWESAPTLQAMENRLSPQVLLSLSLSKINQNKSSEALADLDPFFRGAKDPEYGDSALTLALSTLIDTQAWEQIEPLALRVAMWELKPETKAQLDYARALAFENRGRPENALPLWEGLKNRSDLPPQLQAYTQYFLSRAALRNNDMQNAYYLSREALQSLSDIAEADPSKADTAKIKTLLGSLLDITESSGRTAEALDWYQQYSQYVRDTDEEWPSLRFRLAQLYKASGDTARWSSLLKELAEQYPETLYGRMASSELETHRLRQNISDFMPPAGQ